MLRQSVSWRTSSSEGKSEMRRSPIRYSITTLVLATFSGGAAAAGFQLLEQNASGLGNAYAGQAASAQDASTKAASSGVAARRRNDMRCSRLEGMSNGAAVPRVRGEG